jgi:hypothetical protein
VSFGSVTVGSNNSQTVALQNTGTASLTVNSASFTGAGFNVTGISAPLNLSAGQSSNFAASFSPSSAGSASGNVLFKDSSGTTLLSVPMTGTGVATVSHSVDLSWIDSTSSVVGYRVYRATASGGPYSLISSSIVPNTIYTDGSVSSGSMYFYVVTAVDASNNESSYSNESPASIPTP